MIEDIRSIVEVCRTEERAEILMSITEILFENGYEVSLNQASAIVAINDDAASCIGPIEDIIFGSAQSFLRSAGIEIDLEVAYNQPQILLDVIVCLFEDIESFDDYDTLLSYFSADEPSEIVFVDIIGFIRGCDSTKYLEVVSSVQKSTVDAIERVLLGRKYSEKEDELDNLDRRIVDQIVVFIRACKFPSVKDIFDDGAFTKSRAQLINDTSIAEDSETYDEEIAWAAAGIILSECKNYYDGYALIDEVVVAIDYLDKQQSINQIFKRTSDILKEIYQSLPDLDQYEEVEE